MIIFRNMFWLLLHTSSTLSLSSSYVRTPYSFPYIEPSYSSELNILNEIYEENDGDRKMFLVRNVPGYGSCLFYSLAACITFDRCYKHLLFNSRKMKNFVSQLRSKAVDELRNHNDTNRLFYLDNNQQMAVKDVLKAAAENVNMPEHEYLNDMQRSKTWGGGPEIVALSNYFKRPIHVYELCRHTKVRFNIFSFNLKSLVNIEHKFRLKLCAKFGSPVFDEENKTPYCILCADGRFPHVFPGFHKQKGDHFLALFPVVKEKENSISNRFSYGLGKSFKKKNAATTTSSYLRSGDTTAAVGRRNDRHHSLYIYDYFPFNVQTVDQRQRQQELSSNEGAIIDDTILPPDIFRL